jgi:3D-(3,5/4)-trihydroxycyclohexane-1,2-dione acylhydrolase (decyclizing)
MDVEYGFSCMGYELAGAWGAAIARRDGVVTTLLGDGSYLMLNSELYSAAFAGHGLVAVVCDNDGYAVIDRLQRGNGGSAFNNMYADCRTPHDQPPRVDFASHAAALGCAVLSIADGDLDGLRAAYAQARTHARAGRPAVVVIRTHPSSWTDAGAWWEVGVPEVSENPAVTEARGELEKAKSSQLRYLTHP